MNVVESPVVLADVKALLFDVFGTVVDWYGTVVQELADTTGLGSEDWPAFAKEWRAGYDSQTLQIAEGGHHDGSLNVDIMHRQILEGMLSSSSWSHLSTVWNEKQRNELNLVWHRLNAWPDSTEGLYALKKHFIIATLSDGNVRLLVDMAKHADLPWDVIFSGEFLGSYKPNPKPYLGAAHYLSLKPSECAMVAAHVDDLRGAAILGMKTIYVRRATEDTPDVRQQAKTKAEGGDIDIIVDSFLDLVAMIEGNK